MIELILTRSSLKHISQLTFNELHALRALVTDRMKEMRESGTEQLRLKFIEDAAALGLAPEDVFGTGKKTRKKFRKPSEPSDEPA
jgi:hypothetical protein